MQVAHDIFGRDPAARELDHEMAVIQLITAKGERGTDLQTMNESIFEDEAFNMKVHAMIEGKVELLNPEANRTWRETWDSIKTQLRSMGIAESMRRRKKDSEHIKSLKRTRDVLKGEIDAGLAAQPKVSRYIELESEIKAATKQTAHCSRQRKRLPTTEGKATTTDRPPSSARGNPEEQHNGSPKYSQQTGQTLPTRYATAPAAKTPLR